MQENADRWKRFEAWAVKNRPVLRASDRQRVALELFEMVGDEVVLELDIDNLQKRYREGLLGAQAVMLVKRVGTDILAWQSHELAQKRGGGDEIDLLDEDDEEELHPDPSSRPPASARAWARKKDRPSTRLALAPPRVPDDLDVPPPSSIKRSERPKPIARTDPDEDVETVAPQVSNRPPRRDGDDGDEGELDEDEKAVISRWTFEEDAPARSQRSSVNGPESESVASAPLPPRRNRAEPLANRDFEPISATRASEPSFGEAFVAPESASPGSSRSSSTPPLSESVKSVGKPSPSAALAPSGTGLAARWARYPLSLRIAAGAVVTLLLILALARGAILFNTRDRPAAGLFLSKELGLALTFPSDWVHAPSNDTDESTGNGWQRASATFYRGKSVTSFDAQVTVVSISHASPATKDDLRAFAPSELLERSVQSRCVALPEERVGFRCESNATRDQRYYLVLEEYFLIGGNVVVARGLADGSKAQTAAGQAEAMSSLAQIIDSIEPLDSK